MAIERRLSCDVIAQPDGNNTVAIILNNIPPAKTQELVDALHDPVRAVIAGLGWKIGETNRTTSTGRRQ